MPFKMRLNHTRTIQGFGVVFVFCLVMPNTQATTKAVPPWRWKEPGCFAWSQAHKTYACVAFDAPSFGTQPGDVTTRQFPKTYHYAQKHKIDVRLGVTILNPKDTLTNKTHWRIHSNCTEDCTLLNIAQVKNELKAHKFKVRVPKSQRKLMKHNQWVTLGKRQYRYTVKLSERPISFDYHGKLEIKCTAAQAPVDVFPKIQIGGPGAIISTARGTKIRALTIENHDGGEGSKYANHNHYIFDETKVCKNTSQVKSNK